MAVMTVAVVTAAATALETSARDQLPRRKPPKTSTAVMIALTDAVIIRVWCQNDSLWARRQQLAPARVVRLNVNETVSSAL